MSDGALDLWQYFERKDGLLLKNPLKRGFFKPIISRKDSERVCVRVKNQPLVAQKRASTS